MNPTQGLRIAAYGIVQSSHRGGTRLGFPHTDQPLVRIICMCLHRGAETTASLDAFSMGMMILGPAERALPRVLVLLFRGLPPLASGGSFVSVTVKRMLTCDVGSHQRARTSTVPYGPAFTVGGCEIHCASLGSATCKRWNWTRAESRCPFPFSLQAVNLAVGDKIASSF